jgi:ribonuclease HI
VSPLFASPIGRPHRQPWKRQKGRTPLASSQIIKSRAPQSRLLHADYHLPNANAKQIPLLTVLVRLYLEHILGPFFRGPSPHFASTSTHWGQLRKYQLHVTVAYLDGSANKEQTLAGFGIYFPELSPQLAMRNISSRIPGFQSSARAEAYGILASLMLARRDLPLSIYSYCESLVNTINTYMHRSPLQYEIQYFQNKSLLLRILKEIRGRPCTTTSTHVKAHQRDNQPTFSASPSDSTSRHQEYNKIADRLAKSSLTLDGSPLVPDEHTYLASPCHSPGYKYRSLSSFCGL